MTSKAKRALMVGISIVYATLQTAIVSTRRTIGWQTPAGVTILTYHAIDSNEIEHFERQMRELVSVARPVFADESVDDVEGRRTVAVTFDDGFQNVIDHALPILAKWKIPATVFVPTGFIGSTPGWFSGPCPTLGLPGLLASIETLSSLDKKRVRLGSHTVTHPHLDEVPPTTAMCELLQSKETLEAISHYTVTMLSFPFGAFNADVVELASRAGYAHLFANVPLRDRQIGASRLRGRVSTSPKDWPIEFRLKINGAYGWLPLAIRVKRALGLPLSGKRL